MIRLDEGNTTRERLRAVEVELSHVKGGLKEVKEELTEFKETYDSKFTEITTVINNKLRGSLSGTEKAAIAIALITSVGSIIVSLITVFK